MEDGPRTAQQPLHIPRQQSNQDENQFTGIHIAEQPQGQRNRLGDQLDQLEDEVDRANFRAKRCGKQLVHVAAKTLGLDREANDQEHHRQRHGEGGVDVSGRHHTQINAMRISTHGAADQLGNVGQEVNRQHVHGVHQEHPAEHGQGQRGHHIALGVENIAHLVADHLDDGFHQTLQTTRIFDAEIAHDAGEYKQEDETQNQRHAEGVDVERPKTAVMRRLGVGQVVLDVVSSGACHNTFSIYLDRRAIQ